MFTSEMPIDFSCKHIVRVTRSVYLVSQEEVSSISKDLYYILLLHAYTIAAYTARCLAGMLHKVGLLPAHNRAQIPFAYKFYKDDTLEGWKMSYEFKRAFCIDISVHFIGVFDSVASVGLIPRKLPLSSTPSNKPIYFRHAMGLDEHRSKFKVCRYQQRDHIDPDSHWTTIAEMHERSTPSWQRRKSTKTRDSISTGSSYTIKDEKDSGSTSDMPEKKLMGAREVDCLEVWFSGCHADVGGGAVRNEVRHKLSQIPLRWMIRQCFECNTGILFDSHRLAEEGLDVHTLSPIYFKPRKPTIGPSPQTMEKYENGAIAPISHRATVLEAVDENDKDGLYSVNLWQDQTRQTPADHWIPEQIEDYFDAISPINDQLVEARGWWVLEFWPIKVKIQPRDSDVWVKKVAFNLGRFRPIQETEPNLHWTAHQRMQDKEQAYKVRARLDRNATWKVVV